MFSQWPYAKIMPAMGNYVVFWELNHEDRLGPQGGLQADGRVLNFGSGPTADTADFILWNRNFIPSEVPLFFFDEGLNFVYEVKPDISKEELVRFLQNPVEGLLEDSEDNK